MNDLNVTELQKIIRQHAEQHSIELNAGPSMVNVYGKNYFHVAPKMDLVMKEGAPLYGPSSADDYSSDMTLYLPQENAHTVLLHSSTDNYNGQKYRPIANIHVPGIYRTKDNELHHHLAHQPDSSRIGPAYVEDDIGSITFNPGRLGRTPEVQKIKTFEDLITHARSLHSPKQLEYDSVFHHVPSTVPTDLNAKNFNLHSALELQRRQWGGIDMPKGTENMLAINFTKDGGRTPYLYDLQTERLIPAHHLATNKMYH